METRITVRFSPIVQDKLFEVMHATSLTASEIIRVAVAKFLSVDERAFVEQRLQEHLSKSSDTGTGEPASESALRNGPKGLGSGRPGVKVPPPKVSEDSKSGKITRGSQ